MLNGECPKCKALWPVFVSGHKVAVKGGFDGNYVEDVCNKCGYTSTPYLERPIFVMDGRKRQKPEVEEPPMEVAKTNDEKITFTAHKDDIEISLSVGKEGFIKLFSMFMDGK